MNLALIKMKIMLLYLAIVTKTFTTDCMTISELYKVIIHKICVLVLCIKNFRNKTIIFFILFYFTKNYSFRGGRCPSIPDGGIPGGGIIIIPGGGGIIIAGGK